ncbi:VPA1262 family N-terminal domain-containing protein [Bacillus cereus]|uniref:VPA1262 family N-terminal domain-containing protein n=1 Tax=Bacillus cereus TaxID=1396 RepID=UPI003D032E61
MEEIADEKNVFLTITIYAMEKEGEYYNIFTLARQRSNITTNDWKCFSLKNKTKRFEACFSLEQGEIELAKITSEGTMLINNEENSYKINFGLFQKREPVFIPNYSQKSIANGFWPGTLTEGFSLEQWFSLNRGTEVGLRNHTLRDMHLHLGIQIDKLSDFLYSVIKISTLEDFTPEILYNPDNQFVSFYIYGSVPKLKHRVVLLLGEGEEAVSKIMVDLPVGKNNFSKKIPFSPTKLGYELFQLTDEGYWKLIGSKEANLIRSISLSMGVVQGKLKVINRDNEEFYDIVSYEKSTVMGEDKEESKQPWIQAEADRIRINKSIELQELGSIFVKFDGPKTQEKIQRIIQEKIFEPETKYIFIWDPYLDGSVLNNLLIQAVRYPNMKIKLLMSESGKNSSDNLNEESLNLFERSASIKEVFDECENYKLENVKARNWYRSSGNVFHDRFIITSRGVWQLGSSLKDLGNYHTTIYRLEGNLPEQVENEFRRAWGGDFSSMKPSGFQIIPEFKKIYRKESLR